MSGCSTFTATSRSTASWRARYTVPNVPRATIESMRNRPGSTVPVRSSASPGDRGRVARIDSCERRTSHSPPSGGGCASVSEVSLAWTAAPVWRAR